MNDTGEPAATPTAAASAPVAEQEPVDDGFLQVTPVPVHPEEEKKETKIRTPRRKASARRPAVDQDEKPVSKPKTQAKGSQWGVANGLFKDAFEEIIVEIVALSHYCTNSYRVYKQNATQTDHKIKELTRNYSELA